MVSKTHLPSLLSKHISNNLSVHLFLDFEWQLGKTKEFNTQGLQKVQISSAFKIYSFSVASKNQKADRLCMKFSSTSNASVQQVTQPPISKSMPPYSFIRSISKNISTLRSESTKWKTSFDYCLSPLGLTSSIDSPILS